MMSMLPAIPVLLLGLVAVWFFWPVVVDLITRHAARRGVANEHDRVAEHLFDAWSELRGKRG